MRRSLALIAFALLLAICVQPALALDRLPQPEADSSIVRIADLDRPSRAGRYRADAYWYWRYRAAYTRWMHNEYSRAGHPVRHRQFRTYARN